jgi:hypothetical protein
LVAAGFTWANRSAAATRPDAVNLPDHLPCGWFPHHEKLTGYGRRNSIYIADFLVGFRWQRAVTGWEGDFSPQLISVFPVENWLVGGKN